MIRSLKMYILIFVVVGQSKLFLFIILSIKY